MSSVNELADKIIDTAVTIMERLGKSEAEQEVVVNKLTKSTATEMAFEINKLQNELKNKGKTIELKDLPAVSMNPNDVIVRKDCERGRKDLGDIDELAASILEHEQIQPILITKTNELIAGERRLEACKSINRPVLAVFREQVDNLTLRELELEENLRRKDMTWQEKAFLTKEITDLKQAKYGKKKAGKSQEGWSLGDTAKLMGKSKTVVSQDVELAKALEAIPELRNAKTADDARKLILKMANTVAVNEKIEASKDVVTSYTNAKEHYIISNALKALPKVESNSRDFADVDTPYGIELDKKKKSQTSTNELKAIGTYQEWDKSEYINICRVVAKDIFRILRADSWCTWWFGLEHYAAVKDMLIETGFTVDPLPAMWSAGAKAAQTNQPSILLAKSYDTFFVCRKGNATLAKAGRHNVFDHPKVDAHNKIHPTEKPVDLYYDIISTIINPASEAIVPFLGSGNALRALYQHKCTGFGYDLDGDIKNKFLLNVEADINSGIYTEV